MNTFIDLGLLREVSRSFYLSIRVLPAPMRDPVSLAYLLARASDTLADTADANYAERINWLDGFSEEINGGSPSWRSGLDRFVERQSHPGERKLIASMDEVFDALRRAPDEQRKLIQEVINTIVSGQRKDITRYESGNFALSDASELTDYCYRVAGCVGVFWTRIGFETLPQKFSDAEKGALEKMGDEYGRGLQLVNILRDIPGDLENGRCYLPVDDPSDHSEILESAAYWRDVARNGLRSGLLYAKEMKSVRLRVAAAVPSIIGEKTLNLLDQADWESLKQGIKVSRSTVYRCIIRSLFI